VRLLDPRWRAASLAARGFLAGLEAYLDATGSLAAAPSCFDLFAPKPTAKRLVRELVGLGLAFETEAGISLESPTKAEPARETAPSARPTFEPSSPLPTAGVTERSERAQESRSTSADRMRRLRERRADAPKAVTGPVTCDGQGVTCDASPGVTTVTSDASHSVTCDAPRAPSLSSGDLGDPVSDSESSRDSSPSSSFGSPSETNFQDFESARDASARSDVTPRASALPRVTLVTDQGEVPFSDAPLPSFDAPPPAWAKQVVDVYALSRGVTLDVPLEWAAFLANVHERREQGDRAHASEPSWRKWVARGVGYAEKALRSGKGRSIVQRDPPGPKAYRQARSDDPWDDEEPKAISYHEGSSAPSWAHEVATKLKADGLRVEVGPRWKAFVGHAAKRTHPIQSTELAWREAWETWARTPPLAPLRSRIVQGGPDNGISLSFDDPDQDFPELPDPPALQARK
jgi:hypothetical protein